MRRIAAQNRLAEVLATDAGAHLGDMVWSEVSGVDGQAWSREAIRRSLNDNGVPIEVLPLEITAAGALGRACKEADQHVPGYSVQVLEKRGRDWHVFRTEGAGLDAARVTCATLSVADNGTFSATHSSRSDYSSTRVVELIAARYAHHRDCVSSTDVTGMLSNSARGHLRGVMLKRSGGLYWIPRHFEKEVRALRTVFDGLSGCRLVVMPVYDTAESRAQAGKSVANGIDGEIDQLRKLIGNFKSADGARRESTVQNRLDEARELRTRIELMQEMLGEHAAAFGVRLTEIESEARKLIDVGFDD